MAVDCRFADFAAHRAMLAGYPRDVCVKHDRSVLVSVDRDGEPECLALGSGLVSVDTAAEMDHCALDEMASALRATIDGCHRYDYLDESAVAHLTHFVAFFIRDDFTFESRDWAGSISLGDVLCVTGIIGRVGVVIICLGFARSITTMRFEEGCHRGPRGVILVIVAGSSVSTPRSWRAELCRFQSRAA
jgi:hypothetical protein